MKVSRARGWGDFGRDLVGHLGARVEPATTDPWDGLLVAAFPREDWRLANALDEVAHRTGAPWIPVVLGVTHLRVGPHVRPGSTPCWRCAAGLDVVRAIDSDLQETIERTQAEGATGHTRLHILMAVEALDAALRADPSRVLSVDLQFATLGGSAAATGYHGCSRCAGYAESTTSLRPLNLEEIVAW